MTAAQFEQLGGTEVEAVLQWRFTELVRAGYDSTLAMEVASRVDVDLHTATDLVRHGCPQATALRILL